MFSPTSITHLQADALGEPGCGESWQAGFSLRREAEGSTAGGSFPGHRETTSAYSCPDLTIFQHLEEAIFLANCLYVVMVFKSLPTCV